MSLPKHILDSKCLLIAKIISRVAEPLIWLPLLIWLVISQVKIPPGKQLIYYPVLLVLVFVIPFGYFLYLVFIKKEFDIDVTERSKRLRFTQRSMVSFGVAVTLAYFMDKELFAVTSAVFLATMGLTLITCRSKISFHGGLNTLIFCTVNYLYNWRFWWFFLLLLPIGWSRLVLKKHTLAQYIAGVTLCAVIFLIVAGPG